MANNCAIKFHANSWKFLNNYNLYIEEWEKANPDGKLNPCTTYRQLQTVSEILTRMKNQNGVLLADDAGLGKTAIAALVAWFFAGKGESVRILTPNKTLQRRWLEEIATHIQPIQSVTQSLDVNEKMLINRIPKRLNKGEIFVTTHHFVTSHRDILSNTLNCGLLIIDEAHRAKGENSLFARKLLDDMNKFKKALILTATPFSINIDELNRMLKITDALSTKDDVDAFRTELGNLWEKDNIDVTFACENLTSKAKKAVEAITPYVIRHGFEDLNEGEKEAFGNGEEIFNIEVGADQCDIEILLLTDRLLQLCKVKDMWSLSRTNDPRFYAGWTHLRNTIEKIEYTDDKVITATKKKIDDLFKCSSKDESPHPKSATTARKVKEIVDRGEKVVIFCHHYATAAELTEVIASELKTDTKLSELDNKEVWEEAWNSIIKTKTPKKIPDDYDRLLENYISWLCSPNIGQQISKWLGTVPSNSTKIKKQLEKKSARNKNPNTIAKEAICLFHKLIDPQSKSTLSVLRSTSSKNKQFKSRILGSIKENMSVITISEKPDGDNNKHLFFDVDNIDTVVAVFNSPFGPDVLIVTDRFSEGIDLHGCCRHLIHYELDPSPIRTIQRNGRIRRVNSWAAKVGEPICIYYSVFKNTRDERLVKIMRDRIERFDLLLGGVGGKITFSDENDDAEEFRKTVVDNAKNELSKLSLTLNLDNIRECQAKKHTKKQISKKQKSKKR